MVANEQWFANPGAYEIDYSCRFDGSSSYLTKTFGSAGDLKTWTQSFWMKRCETAGSADQWILNTADSGNTGSRLTSSDSKFEWMHIAGYNKRDTTQVFRDVGAWMHIVIQLDTTQGVEANRSKLWVNGEQVSAYSSATIAEDATTAINNTTDEHGIGRNEYDNNQYFNGYLAEFIFVDGAALTAASFGETNSTTGQWVPKDPSGVTFGSNGFWLDFADSSALGNDVSGNDNDWTTSGLAAADQVVDTPTDNFCTLNPARPPNSNIVFNEGNLRAIVSGSTSFAAYQSTFQIPATGKWYCEIVAVGGDQSISGSANWDGSVGVGGPNIAAPLINRTDNWSWGDARTTAGGKKYHDGQTDLVPASSLTDNSVVMMAIDMDNSKIWWGVDGSWMGTATGDNDGNPATGANPAFDNLSGDLFPGGACQLDPHYWNFGQLGFTHTPPSGFEALSTANLDDPTIADPSAYFQTSLYTGNGSTQSIDQGGNSTFQPDFVWIKNRDEADDHQLFDSVRGVTKVLHSNDTDAEATDADTLTAFDSDGFSLGDDDKVNTSTENYVAWQWLGANGTATNSTGDITSTVCANTTSGFSVLTYTGNGSAGQTIGHGLGAVPQWIFTKRKDAGSSGNWSVYNSTVGINKYIILDLTNAEASNTEHYTATPTTSVYTIGVGGDINTNTATFVAYCFTEIDGYSKFGSYTGNGNADGPFAWTGFKPRFLMTKRTSATEEWTMRDSARSGGQFGSAAGTGGVDPTGGNGLQLNIAANVATEEEDNATGSRLTDFLSNGFKVRSTNTAVNTDGSTYVYMAFAESPFKYATAR